MNAPKDVIPTSLIEKGKKIEIAVPISFIGEAPAEKSLGGVLVKVMHDIEIKALPKDLPSEIETKDRRCHWGSCRERKVTGSAYCPRHRDLNLLCE